MIADPVHKAVMVDLALPAQLPPDRVTIAHILCTSGSVSFTFRGDDYMVTPSQMAVLRDYNRVSDIQTSDDFACRTLFINNQFFEICCPQNGYDARAHLAIALDPLLSLSPEMSARCVSDFDEVAMRLADTEHMFYRDTVMNAVRALVLDVHHIVGQRGEFMEAPPHFARIVHRFISMLDAGDYRLHHEVSYYASCLALSAKYFSEICKKVTGYGANYWINRYMALDIAAHLCKTDLTISDIADKFNFNSAVYFSRFVQRELGMRPKDFRT